MSSSSRHSPLIFVPEDGQAPVIRLQQIELGRGPESGERREKFLQELVHSHPNIIPMQEIEPAFTPLISICRELETPAGYLDKLWLTPDGGKAYCGGCGMPKPAPCSSDMRGFQQKSD
jgi:hypothetical protein